MKAILEEFQYDQPAGEVFALISTGSFQVELLEHLGGRDAELLEGESTPGRVHIVTRQHTPVKLPGFAKKLVPANATITQTYSWSGPDGSGRWSGTWSADIKGAPITIGGTTDISPSGNGAVHVYRGQVKASVPVVGARLEAFAFENLTRDLSRAHEFTLERLGGT